jgi:energy-coupling factor transport system permease protein
MDETQIKQIIERQPLHGTALLDPRCKILLLVCIGFVSYFLAGEVVSLALMLVYGLFIALGNGGKWAAKMIITYIVVAYLNALLRYVQVPVLSVIMSVFGVTVLKLIPIVMMGLWILRTTYMDDLMVALQRMRLPQAVTIPLGFMFREYKFGTGQKLLAGITVGMSERYVSDVFLTTFSHLFVLQVTHHPAQ